MNVSEICPKMLIRKQLLAILINVLISLMLILIVVNLNTDYANTDTNCCIRMIPLCCSPNVTCGIVL